MHKQINQLNWVQTLDAWVRWNKYSNEFELDEIFDSSFCHKCQEIEITEWHSENLVTEEIALTSMSIMDLTNAKFYDNRKRLYIWLSAEAGICAARENALLTAPVANKAWDIAKNYGFNDSFDFEFLPIFLTLLMDFCEAGPPKNMHDEVLLLISRLSFKRWESNT
ncbi:hypothetical protein [Parvularcula sp. IMCC14364]|uniref:hypothetical protein n=1 Tax=Parvularcula sp. IMCC14364 TaxID=3067902 RepID=UPI0027415E78|nr:hypothetical protein [Parvularcula sp. IMCC14364]